MKRLRSAQKVKVNLNGKVIECYVLQVDYDEVLVMKIDTFEVLGIYRSQII